MASDNTSAGHFSNPMAELRRRKATGEISADEFQRAKSYLREEMAKQANTSDEPVGTSKVSWRTVILAAVVGFMFLHWYAPNTSPNTTELPLGKADGTRVMSSAYGASWPFPDFDHGVIQCKETLFGDPDGYHLYQPVVTIILGGTKYGLNAPGLSLYPDPRPFIPTDDYGMYKSGLAGVTSQLLQIGLTQCGEAPSAVN